MARRRVPYAVADEAVHVKQIEFLLVLAGAEAGERRKHEHLANGPLAQKFQHPGLASNARPTKLGGRAQSRAVLQELAGLLDPHGHEQHMVDHLGEFHRGLE